MLQPKITDVVDAVLFRLRVNVSMNSDSSSISESWHMSIMLNPNMFFFVFVLLLDSPPNGLEDAAPLTPSRAGGRVGGFDLKVIPHFVAVLYLTKIVTLSHTLLLP